MDGPERESRSDDLVSAGAYRGESRGRPRCPGSPIASRRPAGRACCAPPASGPRTPAGRPARWRRRSRQGGAAADPRRRGLGSRRRRRRAKPADGESAPEEVALVGSEHDQRDRRRPFRGAGQQVVVAEPTPSAQAQTAVGAIQREHVPRAETVLPVGPERGDDPVREPDVADIALLLRPRVVRRVDEVGHPGRRGRGGDRRARHSGEAECPGQTHDRAQSCRVEVGIDAPLIFDGTGVGSASDSEREEQHVRTRS